MTEEKTTSNPSSPTWEEAAAQIRIRDYDYPLPPQQIALHPLPQRDASRFLVYANGHISDEQFASLPQHLPQGATLAFNNTRVIEARLLFRKATGGVIEIFCLQPHEQTIEQSLAQKSDAAWQCLIGGASKWKPGQLLTKEMNINGEKVVLTAHYVEKLTDGFVVRFAWSSLRHSFAEVIQVAGHIPLPPYIKRQAEAADAERYQTVFAEQQGSVAAPTAALHFTEAGFRALQLKGINAAYLTLHVGAGTFKPVKAETAGGHYMHEEPFSVTKSFLQKMIDSQTVVAVGTTSLRTLESLHWLGVKAMKGLTDNKCQLKQWEAYELEAAYGTIDFRQSFAALIRLMEAQNSDSLHCTTSLMIVPGYRFAVPEAIITNFHQPQSTLLLLIAAFIGENWKRVYKHALEKDYRFLSYGDSSLLWRKSRKG